ncbi:caspase family protein [Microcoleus sp. AT9_B5]
MARYALVIGIAQYQSSNLKPLPKAATDAEVVARVLEVHGEYTVTRLPERWNAETQRFEVAQQKSVSADEVCEALQNLLLEQGTKSDVLIYFAGHGLTFFDNLGEKKGVLATSDCQVEMVGKKVVNYNHGIDLSSLNRLIEKSDLSSLVMLLDCCHSGYFLESQLVQQTLTAFSKQRDYYLITACRSGETVKALAWEAHAIFTGALLKGLASENASRNGQVSGDRLFDYISNELKGTQWGQEAIRMGWGRCITLVKYPPSETSATEITFDRTNPYLGLYAFEAEQEKYFCGREEAVWMLITHLTNSRFLSVIGYSGSGKSSLIKAGLLPELSRDRIPGSSQWPVESFTPGKHPLGKLVDILARYREQNQHFVIFIDQFEEVFTLCEDESERQSFIRLIAEEMNDSERKSRMIIAIRGDFLIRCADYSEVLNLINRIPPRTYIVKSLGIEELPEAIEKPAELHGVKFERGLVSQIAQDVAGQPGALPLLQYALKELWRVCIEKPELPEPLLTKKGYDEIGGVQGALENRANVIYQSLSDGDRIFVRKLFMELVQLGEGKEVTRRRVDWDRLRAIADSPEQLERVIGLLAGAQQRLIIVDENTVEVAHEALLCRWKLLSNWIEEDLENIRIRRRLEVACREWEKTYGKSDDALLTGARLAEVEEWQKRVQPDLTGDERDFLGKSVGRRDREIQAQLEQERQLRELAEANAKVEAARAEEERAKTIAQMERAIAAEDKVNAETARVIEAEARVRVQKQRTRLAIAIGIVLVLSTVVAAGLANWVFLEKRRVIAAEKKEVNAIISQAENLWQADDQLGALEASVEALKRLKQIGEEGENFEAIRRLRQVITQVKERNRLEHKGQVDSVSWNQDGHILASGSTDGRVNFWKPDGTSIERVLPKQAGSSGSQVSGISFSKNGQMVSAHANGSIILWKSNRTPIKNLAERQLPTQNQSSETRKDVYGVSFSSDGKTIASAHVDGTVKLWSSNGTFIRNLPDLRRETPEYVVHDVAFSPNGQIIASTHGDGAVKLWKSDGTLLKKLVDPSSKSSASEVSFSPDGKTIGSAHSDGTVRLWNLDGSLRITLTDENKGNFQVDSISFSPNRDRAMIAAGCSDQTIRVWNIGGKKNPPIVLKGHKDDILGVSFSPDGQQIASSSADGTVRLWRLTTTNEQKEFDRDERADIQNLWEDGCEGLKFYLLSHNKEKKYRWLCE